MIIKSVLNRSVSMFNSYADITPIDTNLLNFLTNRSFKETIDRLRTVTDKATRCKLKSKLPAVTVSGTFSFRGEKHLIKHSGLISFDLDNVKDLVATQKAIAASPYVAYLALSASGRGLFGIMAISNPEKHKEHFKGMAKYIESLCGLKIDPAPSSVCSLRGYSYDEYAYINHHPEVFTALITTPASSRRRVTIRPDIALNEGPFEAFNAIGDIRDLLEAHGWQLQYAKGSNHYYSRPGKDAGISADYCVERKTFYVFTSSSIFEARKGYNNAAVFSILECNGDFALARRKLLDRGYGSKISIGRTKRVVLPTNR